MASSRGWPRRSRSKRNLFVGVGLDYRGAGGSKDNTFAYILMETLFHYFTGG